MQQFLDDEADSLIAAVDTHVHILKLGQPLIEDRHSAPIRSTSVEELLGLMGEREISHAVVTAPSFYGPNNVILLDALAAGGGRLFGTVHVEPGVSEGALLAMKEQGVRGLRFNWFARRSRPDPRTKEYRELFEMAAKVGLHVEVFIEPELLADFSMAVLDAGAVLVVDHFGMVNVEHEHFSTVSGLLEDRTAWVKLSAPYRLPRGLRDAALAAKAFAEIAPDQLLWGSDWPWVGHEHSATAYASTRSWLDEWFPDEAMIQSVLNRNPRRLLGMASESSMSVEPRIRPAGLDRFTREDR